MKKKKEKVEQGKGNWKSLRMGAGTGDGGKEGVMDEEEQLPVLNRGDTSWPH